MYRVLDLFSGIGGFSLGLERTGGFQTVAFCEIDPYCRKVLAKHWLGVPIYEDVRELTAERLRADGIVADVITGGFPCQDISVAGLGAGIEGERSGLWAQYARLICELRPSFVVVENVSALLGRGMDRVLGDLAEIGFDAEWHCIPASAIGAPHRRDRVWIIAHAQQGIEPNSSQCDSNRQSGAHPNDTLPQGLPPDDRCQRVKRFFSESVCRQPAFSWCENIRGVEDYFSRPDLPEPLLWRINDGLRNRVDALGNSVVPQIPELIGRAILQAEGK